MLKKTFSLIFLLLSLCSVNAQKTNIKVVFHLKNADSSYYSYFMDEDKELYIDTVANEIDSFTVYFPEPKGITMVIENDTSKMLNFYAYSERLEMYIDATHIHQSKFINSPLNDEYIDSRRRADSIKNMVYTKEIRELLKKTNFSSTIKDSIRNIYNLHYNELNKQLYLENLSKPKSFHTLEYLNFWVQDLLLKKEKSLFTKKELNSLFKKLDKRIMKDYPTYKACKTMLKHKPEQKPSINEPLLK